MFIQFRCKYRSVSRYSARRRARCGDKGRRPPPGYRHINADVDAPRGALSRSLNARIILSRILFRRNIFRDSNGERENARVGLDALVRFLTHTVARIGVALFTKRALRAGGRIEMNEKIRGDNPLAARTTLVQANWRLRETPIPLYDSTARAASRIVSARCSHFSLFLPPFFSFFFPLLSALLYRRNT